MMIDVESEKIKSEIKKQYKSIKMDKKQIEEAYELERKIFELNGYEMSELEFLNYSLDEEGDVYIHAIETKGDKEKPWLFIGHGYGGSLVTFINLIKIFNQQFHVVAFDFLGMGLSSRTEFCSDSMTTEEVVEYFVSSTYQMIKSMMTHNKLSKVNLMGHSLGGYLLSQLALQHSSIIRNLYLLSPLGVSILSEEKVIQMQQQYQQLGLFRRTFLSFMSGLANKQLTPAYLFQKFGCLAKWAIERILTQRLGLDKNQADFQLFKQYMIILYSLPVSSEKCLHKIVKFDKVTKLSAFHPLENLFSQSQQIQQLNILFFFGDRDWMDSKGAYRLANTLPNVSIFTIDNATHHLNMNNPQQIFTYILKFHKNKKKIFLNSNHNQSINQNLVQLTDQIIIRQ